MGTKLTNKSVIDKLVKPALRGHLWDKEKVALWDRWPLKWDSIHKKISMMNKKKAAQAVTSIKW
jgi:hypothetical protein